MTYYGAFYRSALYPLLRRISTYLLRWIHEQVQEAADLEESHPGHGRSGREPAAVLRALGLGETGSPDDQDDKSRVTGDCYARICGSPGVRFPRATRPGQVERKAVTAGARECFLEQAEGAAVGRGDRF